MHVTAIYISPVKSLALASLDRAWLDKPGIPGDRAFHLADDRGRLVTQREVPSLVQLHAAYDADTDALHITFPDGRTIAGSADPSAPATTSFWGNWDVEGHDVRGELPAALSAFAGQPLRIVKGTTAGRSFDGYPLSICSTASVEALRSAAGVDAVDARRFRQNIMFDADRPHIEDEWLGREVRIGEARVRMKIRDSRCVMTTHNPDTGETDLNTLKIIASYRTDQPKEVNFGVYATVVEPGFVAVGDAITPP
jgi:uncharacterized protein YcbX